MLAPNHGITSRSPTYQRGGVAKCAKGIQNACFSTEQKLTHAPAREEAHAEQETPLHYSHYCMHQPLKGG